MADIAYPTTGVTRPHPRPRPESGPALRLVPSGSARRRRPSAVRRTVFLRRRLLAVAALIVCTLALIGAAALVRTAVGVFGGGPLTSPETPTVRVQPVASESYIVRPGDTLWSIAL